MEVPVLNSFCLAIFGSSGRLAADLFPPDGALIVQFSQLEGRLVDGGNLSLMVVLSAIV
jgi:hypothetical protein